MSAYSSKSSRASPARGVALLQVGLVTAAVQGDLLLDEVEFEDLGDGAAEELAVVADDDGARAQSGDEALQALQAVQVEVVGRLVEQEDVVAGQEQRGESGAGRLAAGQGGHRLVEADAEAEGVGDLGGAFVEVGASEVEPAFQAVRIGVVRAGRSVDEGLRRLVHHALGLVHARAAREEVPDGLALPAFRFLWQVSDGRGRRGELQLALLRGEQTGEQAQQGGLARAVGADEPDHVTGSDDEVESGEEGAVAVSGGEVLGDEGGSHQGADFNGRPSRSAPPIGTGRRALADLPPQDRRFRAA